jgi:hypothetical protein
MIARTCLRETSSPMASVIAVMSPLLLRDFLEPPPPPLLFFAAIFILRLRGTSPRESSVLPRPFAAGRAHFSRGTRRTKRNLNERTLNGALLPSERAFSARSAPLKAQPAERPSSIPRAAAKPGSSSSAFSSMSRARRMSRWA